MNDIIKKIKHYFEDNIILGIKEKNINKLLNGIILFILPVFLYSVFVLFYKVYSLNIILEWKYIIITFIILLIIISILFTQMYYRLKAKKAIIVLNVITIILFSVNVYSSSTISNIISSLNTVTDDYVDLHIDLILNKNLEIGEDGDLSNLTLATYKKDSNLKTYEMTMKYLEEKNLTESVTIVEYENVSEAIYFLLEEGTIDGFFTDSGTIDTVKELYDNLEEKIVIHETYSVKYLKSEIAPPANDKNLEMEPFSILLMGVDSRYSGDLAGQADVMMLLNFNPKTLKLDLVSIPRDLYVPMACRNDVEDKITHSNWGGTQCVISTVSNLFDIKVDYYLKVNFYTVIDLINIVGGVEAHVQNDMTACTWVDEYDYTVRLKSGYQKLDGYEALMFMRERNSCGRNPGYNDFVRGRNQQMILESLVSELASTKILFNINDVIKTFGDNFETNMTMEQIRDLYNIGKTLALKNRNSKTAGLLINKLQVSGYDAWVYEWWHGFNIYYYVPFKGSIRDIKTQLNITRGEIVPPLPTKKQYFAIGNDYTSMYSSAQKWYNEPIRKFPEPKKIPNFVESQLSREQIKAWGEENNIEIKFNEIYDEWLKVGKIISQSIIYDTPISRYTKLLEIEISIGPDPNVVLKNIKINSFESMTPEEVEEWAKDRILKVKFEYVYSDTVPEGYVIGAKEEGEEVLQRSTINVMVSKGEIPKYYPEEELSTWTETEWLELANTINQELQIVFNFNYIEKDPQEVQPGTILNYIINEVETTVEELDEMEYFKFGDIIDITFAKEKVEDSGGDTSGGENNEDNSDQNQGS